LNIGNKFIDHQYQSVEIVMDEQSNPERAYASIGGKLAVPSSSLSRPHYDIIVAGIKRPPRVMADMP
jgi:hypothetical protein